MNAILTHNNINHPNNLRSFWNSPFSSSHPSFPNSILRHSIATPSSFSLSSSSRNSNDSFYFHNNTQNIHSTQKSDLSLETLLKIKQTFTSLPETSSNTISSLLKTHRNFHHKRPFFPNTLNLQDYSIQCELGSGSYSTVYLSTELKTNKKYALKKIILNDIEELSPLKDQISLVSSINNLNIVSYIKSCTLKLDFSTYSCCILMPLAKSDWSKEIERKNELYEEYELIEILKSLVYTLSQMQRKGIAHRDIKPQNIFVYEDGVYRIGDFDEMIKIKNKDDIEVKGTETFMSPKLINAVKEGCKYLRHNIFKSDVYSLGLCVLYAMEKDYEELFGIRRRNDVENGKWLERRFKGRYSKEFLKILGNMLRKEEKDRYDFIELNKEIGKMYKK